MVILYYYFIPLIREREKILTPADGYENLAPRQQGPKGKAAEASQCTFPNSGKEKAGFEKTYVTDEGTKSYLGPGRADTADLKPVRVKSIQSGS